jgi:RNA polymerase sigma factor (sigma-70 family)
MAAVVASGAGGLAMAEQHRLADASRAGDQEAFSELVRRLAPGLHRYLVATGTAASDADDLVQEAFIRAHRALADFDRRYAFTTWLYTIAHRLRLNRRARVDRQVALGAIPEPAAPEADAARFEEAPATPLWDLARALLPERQMHALWLRYGEDMDIGAIARVLGTNALNIRVMLHRARARLARAAPQDLRQNEGTP